MSYGCASGQSGLLSKKWNKAGSKILPCELLNSGVMIMLIAIEPIKNGVNDHAPCGVPLNRKAGKCQKPQIMPSINPAQKGASFLCNRGSASPRQPNSSTGPVIAVNNNATRKQRNEENGYISVKRLPFNADPQIKINEMPTIKNTYQISEHRQSKKREK